MGTQSNGDMRIFDNLSGMQYDNLAGFTLFYGESHEELARMVKAIYDTNLRSMVLETRYHPEYCEEKYFDDIRFVFDECRKLGMHIWLMDDCQCPSGSCKYLPQKPEYDYLRPWEVRETHVDVAGPMTDGSVMVDCWLKDESESVLSVVAAKRVPDSSLLTGELVDLSDNLHDGMVYFDLSDGVWRIFVLIKTRQNTEPFIDKLRSECTEFYIQNVHQKIYDNLSEYFGNTFLGFFNDEAGFHNNGHNQYITPMGTEKAQYPWGKCVVEGLKKIYGDKLYTRLIGLWYNFEDCSEEKVRVEYMDIISKAFYENFSSKIAGFCHTHGIQLIGHILEDKNAHAKTGYGCGHFFRAVGDQDMSGIDTVLHQHIPGMTQYSNRASTSMVHHDNVFYNYYLAKLGASYAHIDSRKKGRLMCEIFGAYGNAEGTKMMKYMGDHMLVRGANYLLPCLFTTNHTKRNHFPPYLYCGDVIHPFASYYGDLMNYMNRVTHLLTDGIHVSSCAIFYDAHGIWTNTDFVEGQAVAKVLYDNLYDFDILPIEYVEKIDEKGMINGEKYPVLFLPYSSYLPQDIIQSLKNADIEVICVSDKGQKSPDFPTIDLTEIPDFMKSRGLGDVKSDYNGIYLRSYHYTRNGTHYYMFVNEDINNEISANVTLSEFSGGTYAIYDPLMNKAWRCSSAERNIHRDLPVYSSVFVICGDMDYESLPELPLFRLDKETEADSVYDISLSEDGKEFTHYITTDKLFNVTGYKHNPHFSGNIRYQTKLKFKKSDKIELNLGYVGEAAEVTVNGQSAGKRFAPPYTFDVTDLIKDGENSVEINVANSLVHRIMDMRSTYLVVEPSGIMGPVKIKNYSIK